MRRATPDYVLAGTAAVLRKLLPLLRRTPGGVADPVRYAKYRDTLDRLIGDCRAAARSPELAADLAAVFEGYRLASSDQRAVLAGLERIAVAARAHEPIAPRTPTLASQRRQETALTLLFEGLALSGMAQAAGRIRLTSHDEAARLRVRLGRTFDLGIDRASEAGALDMMRSLRVTAAALTRDLIERGRPLAWVVSYETGASLPAVVLAHMLYQDAGRASELRAENQRHDHPAFMPLAGMALSR